MDSILALIFLEVPYPANYRKNPGNSWNSMDQRNPYMNRPCWNHFTPVHNAHKPWFPYHKVPNFPCTESLTSPSLLQHFDNISSFDYQYLQAHPLLAVRLDVNRLHRALKNVWCTPEPHTSIQNLFKCREVKGSLQEMHTFTRLVHYFVEWSTGLPQQAVSHMSTLRCAVLKQVLQSLPFWYF